MTAELVLAAVEARLLAAGAYESLWHLERMGEQEKALLVERELRDENTGRAPGSPQAAGAMVAA